VFDAALRSGGAFFRVFNLLDLYFAKGVTVVHNYYGFKIKERKKINKYIN
jgi:hypothetical protein